MPEPHNEMIERVAKAIEALSEMCVQDLGRADLGIAPATLHAVEVRKAARAAILAMREPTEAMKTAGMDAVSAAMKASEDRERDFISPYEAGIGFEAMIDAATSEESRC